MPRRQRTFSVIPDGAGLATAADGRPMTSKQVRKAYRSKTKAPAMSRAERLLWERREQERIRRELEREKTAAKARAVRERKREREREEREEKRRNGLPLVSVRPSQDTISRFVRGGGPGGRKGARLLSPVGEDGAGECEPDDGVEERDGEHEGSMQAPEPLPGPFPVDSEDDFDGQLLSETREDETCGRSDSPGGLLVIHGFEIHTDDDYDDDDDLVSMTDSACAVTASRNPQATSKPDVLADLDLLSEGNDLEPEMLALEATTPPKHHPGCMPRLRPTAFERDLGLDTLFLAALRPEPPRPKPPDTRSVSPQPPLSTQAIFSHADDFFPTASQLERELREDTPSGTQGPCRPAHGVSTSPGSTQRRFWASFDEEVPCAPPRRRREPGTPKNSTQQRRAAGIEAEKEAYSPRCRALVSTRPSNSNTLVYPREHRRNKEALPVRRFRDKGPASGPPASQESFGGDWLDDAASELLV